MTATSIQAPSYTPSVSPPLASRSASLVRRLAERFALVALGLYHLPLFINNYPSLGGGGFNEDGLAPAGDTYSRRRESGSRATCFTSPARCRAAIRATT